MTTKEELADACREMQASACSLFKKLYALDVQASIARTSLDEARAALLKSGAQARSAPLPCEGETK